MKFCNNKDSNSESGVGFWSNQAEPDHPIQPNSSSPPLAIYLLHFFDFSPLCVFTCVSRCICLTFLGQVSGQTKLSQIKQLIQFSRIHPIHLRPFIPLRSIKINPICRIQLLHRIHQIRLINDERLFRLFLQSHISYEIHTQTM